MTPTSTALLILAMVLVVAIMALVQKPRRPSTAFLDDAIELTRRGIAEAKRCHRPTAKLQASLERLVAEKLRAELDLFKASSRWRGAR